MSAREDLAALAESCIGFEAPSSEYMDLLGPMPPETPQTRAPMATQNGCALTVRGLFRRLGVQHRVLAASYMVGQAMADLVRIGSDANALVHAPGADFDFARGHVLILNAQDAPTTHALTVVEVQEGSLASVDGGRRDPHSGNEWIERVSRSLVRSGDGWLLGGRTVSYVIDPDLLTIIPPLAWPTMGLVCATVGAIGLLAWGVGRALA